MGEEEGKKKREVVVESLGWLTESSIMPKKHKAIAGVGPSSILELKAQLYKTQQEQSRKSSNDPSASDLQFRRPKKKIPPTDFSAKNSGVEARANKDKLELKAVHDGSASYEALERKAELYDKLVRGELSDEEDKEKYCVDFFQKSLDHTGTPQPQCHDSSAVVPPNNEHDGESDASSRFETKFVGPGSTTGTVDNNEHKRFVREVHEEVNKAREKASELKLRRQEQATARREKLKQAYLRKQLEKLKSATKTEQA